ncbi:MAG: histidinol dehydrogenase [Lachnospiraceae bacterium]|nr:histidinol dehydrogenase [Lachnospiraceae bacterium]
MKIVKLDESSKKNLLKELLKRSPGQYREYEDKVAAIVEDVRDRGDEAVFEYTKKFDGFDLSPENILVTQAEIDEAYAKAGEKLVSVIRKATANIRDFHERQKERSWFETPADGIFLGQKVTPLKRAGVYVPGGKAAYPSSVLMNVIPARVAGVDEVIMCTPPGKDGVIYEGTLVAAKEAGVDKIYKVGGAQAIAAMAFGTDSVPRVDKITGPGNIYVALAKKSVYGNVSIDSIAGPSEILVLADETANASYVASDLLSQAEHDELACAILITTSSKLAEEVNKETERMTKEMPREKIISASLNSYGYILVADNMKDAIDAVDEIAPEHLEIQTKDPYGDMAKVRNAGAIFLGPYSSEPLGDYWAGPNHILPTNGTARFFSAVSVEDFIKKSSVISYSREALEAAHEDIEFFAKAEGLYAHAASIAERFR